jgi:hypothetical protein
MLQKLKDQDALTPDGTISTDNRYLKDNSSFSIPAESIRYLTTNDTGYKGIISGTDNRGHRVFWNKEKLCWVPEFGMSAIDKHPEAAPYVPLLAYYDGSAHYSTAVYIAEHPGLIDPEASYPYYVASVRWTPGSIGGIFFRVGVIGDGFNIFPNETKISYKVNKPYAYLGIQQTTDESGSIIYVIVKDSWNPTEANRDQSLPIYLGLDKTSYEEFAQYPLLFLFTSNKKDMPGEIMPIFPASTMKDVSRLSDENNPANPHVASLQNADVIKLFAEHDEIQTLIDRVANGQELTAVTNNVALASLPP